MKRYLKIATGAFAATLIILAFGLIAVFLNSLLICFASVSGWHCADYSTGAEKAELDAIQTMIDVFMIDQELAEVTPSASSAGGEIIRGVGSQFHPTLDVQPYMRAAASTFCYRWESDGEVTFQYDVNADGNCAIDAEQLYP